MRSIALAIVFAVIARANYGKTLTNEQAVYFLLFMIVFVTCLIFGW